jgi:hypothetical protein
VRVTPEELVQPPTVAVASDALSVEGDQYVVAVHVATHEPAEQV